MYRGIIGAALVVILVVCLMGGKSSGEEPGKERGKVRVFLAAPSDKYGWGGGELVDVRWPATQFKALRVGPIPKGRSDKDCPICASDLDFFTIAVYTADEIDHKYKELQKHTNEQTAATEKRIGEEIIEKLNTVVRENLREEVLQELKEQARKDLKEELREALKEELREKLKEELYSEFKGRILKDKVFLKQLTKQLPKGE